LFFLLYVLTRPTKYHTEPQKIRGGVSPVLSDYGWPGYLTGNILTAFANTTAKDKDIC